MIFRDDDISESTCLDRFKSVDSIFREYKVDHTVAVIAAGIEANTPLVDYINAHPHIKVQLHCWTHGHNRETDSMPRMGPTRLADDLANGIEKLLSVFGVRASVLYPPWNETDATVERVAGGIGLIVSHKKTSLEAFIRASGRAAGGVVNFHYWSERECGPGHSTLEKAVALFAKTR